MPVPEETQDVIAPLVTRTEVQRTSISQRESECPSSPSTTYMDSIEPETDKNAETEGVQLAVEDVRPEVENDHEMSEALNQRQEEEEEDTQWEEKSKEEEEESKDGDNRKEEEEESREEEAKPPEAKGNQEEAEESNIMEAGEGEESKEEGTNPVEEDNSQEMHNPPLEQDHQVGIDHEQDDRTSLGNNADADLGMETESETAATPAPEIVSPSSLNPGEAVDDEPTSVDEPVVFTRREHAKIFHI